MDANRFDSFVSSLARPDSRRKVLRALGAGGFGAGLAALGLRESALACKGNGEECDRNQAEQCCSGTCKKKGGKSKCVKAKGAFGCKNKGKTDACQGNDFPCPNNPEGSCVVDEKKRPLCAGSSSECFPCANDQECKVKFVASGARCIKQCATCAEESGGRACIVPPGQGAVNGMASNGAP